MFLDNQHTQEYYEIIKRNQTLTQNLSVRQIKSQLGYTEKHHIIPRSMGGNNTKENTVYMSAEDHLKCHWLLVDMTTDAQKGKMWSGLWRMMNKQSKNQQRNFAIAAEDYALARENHAKSHKERMSGSNNSFYNKKHSKDTLEVMSLAKKGKTYEEIFGIEHANLMRQRRRNEQLGKKKGPQDKISCVYCGMEGGKGIMKRWHGEKCKHRETLR